MNKRKVIGAVIGIILFAITVVSITYAYYSWRSSNTDITFNIDDSYFYCETDIDSSVSSLAPTNDYRNGSVQTFHVNNVGRSDTTFSLSMNITSISDVLKDESFKYKLMLDPTNGSKNCASTSENGCTLVGEGNFSEVHTGMNTLVQSLNLPNNTRYQYYFFMYLDGTMNNPTGIQNGSMESSLGVCDIYAYFDPNGDGASVSPTFKKVTVDQAYGTLPTPTRSNAVVSFNTNGGSDVDSQTVEFKFGGWFKTSDAQANAQLTAVTADSSKATTQATIVQDVENHTLKARWQDSNGKYGETSNLCITLPATPTKKGYTFNGWYLDSGANNKIGDPGAKYCPSKTTIIYAGWTAKTYTVKYDCNGGSKPSGKLGNATATFDQTFTVSSDLCTRTGYTKTTNSEWKDPTNVVWKKAWSGKWTYDNGQYGIANNELTLKAQWTANSYTIGYTLNGGSNPNPKPTSGAYDADVQIGNPTKTVTVTVDANGTGATISGTVSKAQTFSGWTSTTMGSNAKTGTAANPDTAWTGTSTKNTYFKNLRESGTVTMVANWTAVKIDKLPKVTKPGYTCTINTKADGTGTSYASEGTNYTPSANSAASVTLYARCTANSYTIGYTLNGGSNPNPKPTSGTYDADVQIGNPTKTFTVNIDANSQGATIKNSGGTAVTSASSTQTFSGWTSSTLGSNAKTGTAANPSTAWNGSSTKNTYFKNLREFGTVTMVANWTAVNVTLPLITKTGYTCGYATSASGAIAYASGAAYAPSTTTNSTTLYAKCTPNSYTVKYASTTACPLNTTTYANKSATYNIDINIANPTCTGYTFTGWTASGDIDTSVAKYGTAANPTTTWANGNKGTYFRNLASKANGTVTLTAGWTINTTTVRYHANGGIKGNNDNGYTVGDDGLVYKNGNLLTATVNYGATGVNLHDVGMWYDESSTSAYNIHKVGYNGSGFKTSNGTTINKDNTTYDLLNDNTTPSGNNTVTVYVQWTAKKLTIRYNKNDGSGATSNETFTYDGNMDDNNFNPPTAYKTRTGYTFAGWSMKADGSDNIRWGFNVRVGESWFLNQMGTAATKTVDVYAIWTANNYTIGYTMNGGTKVTSCATGASPTSSTYDTDVRICNPTKTVTVTVDANGTGATISGTVSKAQTFSGWTSTTVGSNAKTGTEANPSTAWNGSSTKNTYFKNLRESGTVTMVANWTAVKIDKLPKVTKAGYTCTINTKADGTGTSYASEGTNYTPAANSAASVTLYAICTINSYTLTINPNGGSFNNTTNNTTVTQNYNTTYGVLNNPTRAGYVFNGWTLSGSGSFNIYDSSVTPTETKTFNYNASNSTLPNAYNNSGGGTVTNSMVADSTATGGYSLKIVTNGTASPGAGGIYLGNAYSTVPDRINVVEVKAKIPTGYSIQLAGIGYQYTGIASGWKYNDNAGTGAWKTYYLVVYTGNTGTFSSIAYINLTGSNNTSVTWYINSVVVKSYTKAQYKSIYTFGTGNGTLTANWAVGGSRVTFNNNGGTFDTTKVKNWNNGYNNVTTSSADKVLEYNKSYATYPGDSNYNWIPDTRVISRTGHTFDGWQTANNGGTKVFNANGTLISSISGYSDSSGKWIKYDANVTLYAKWNVNSYTLTYDCTTNGGSTANSTQSYNYGASVDLTKTCTKSGWTFVGWAESSTATTKLNSYTMPASNKTLYAIYRKEAITRKITFNLNGNTSFTYNGTKKTVTTTYDACTIAAVYNTATQATSCSATITMPTIEAPTNTPTVKGWSTGATTYSGYLAVSSSQSISFNSDKTYFAQTEKVAVDGNVTFKLNDNTNFIGKSGFGLGTTTYTADKTVKICTIVATHNGTAQGATCTASGTMPTITAPANTPTVIGWSNGQNTHTATHTSGKTGVTLTSGTTWWAQTTKAAVDGNVTFKLNNNTNFIGKSGFGLGTTTYTADKTVKICTIAATYNGVAQGTTCTASGTMPTITAPANTPTVIGWSNGQNTHTATHTSGKTGVTLTSGTTWWAQTSKAAVDGNVTFKLNNNTNFIGKSGFGLGTTTYTADKTVKICTIAATYNGVAQGTTCTASGTMPTITAPVNTPTVIGWSNGQNTHTATHTSGKTGVTLTSGTTWWAQTEKAAVDGNVTFKLNNNTNFIGKSGFGLGTTTYTADKTVKICTIAATYNGTAQAATCTASGTMPKITAPTNTPTLIGWSNGQNTHTATYTSEQTSVTLTSGTTWWAQSTAQLTATPQKNVSSATGSPSAVSCYRYNGASSCNVTAPAANSYTLSNWSIIGWKKTNNTTTTTSTATSGDVNPGASLTLTANTNIVAIWRKSVTVTFNNNNCSTSNPTATGYAYNNGTAVTVKTPAAPSMNSGWTFVGFNASNAATTGTAANTNMSLTVAAANTTATAYQICKGAQFTATPQKNVSSATGTASAVSCNPYNGATSCTVTAPAANSYTLSNWTIIGWKKTNDTTTTTSTATSGDANPGASLTLTASTNIVAIWRKTVAVTMTFDKNGGSANTSSTAVNAYAYNGGTTLTGNVDVTAPAYTTRSGWTIIGYADNATSDHTSEWNAGAKKSRSVAGVSVAVNATSVTVASGYYHIWKNDNAGTVYTATPQKNVSSATGSPSALSCTIATVYNNATRPTSCNITTPAANAYSLSSWTLFAWVNAGTSTTSSATSGTNVNTSMAISGNINLVALWKKTPTITVTFDKNGGNANTSTTFTSTIYNGATTVVSASRSLTAPACTTRTGYTCLGYGDNAGDTASEWNVGASKSITVPAATVAIGATTGSVASGYYHVWKGNTYTATFYYNSNTTSGSTTVASKQVSCTVSNTAGNCSVTIPTEVTGSGGTYNNAYAGLSSSTGNMTQAVAAGTTSLTLTSSPTYYSLYRTEIKIVYPTSTTAATSKSTYQNQWFSSTTAMATTVLSTTTTGTTTNATAATVSGYGTLVGFNTAASKNTANVGATIAALTQTNSGRNASRTVYQINKKAETVNATFYYYNGSAQATTTNSGTKTTFIRPTSATAAGTSVSHGTLTSPSIPALVSSSTGPVSLGYIGVSTSASSTTTTTSITTASTKYYAVYGGSYTASFTKENNNVSGIGSTSLSCSGSYTTNGTTYSGTPCSVTLPAITAATGYVAKGWYNSTGTTFVGNAGSSVTLTANTTYMAKAVRLTASDFSYDNSETGVDCDDTQCMIDWLDGFYPGAYVSYTPTKTSYTTDMSKTGYTSTQTINPSELNLWRLLRKNNNGTVDIISEYVSSTDVYFKGQTGYQNLVGYLNVLASQYENSTYTSGSRYFGYNGQTQYITDTSKFISTAPWSCDTGGSCSPAPVESQGGGDTLYTTDYNLVNTALGTRVANKVGTTTATNYWMASRYYKYNSSTWYLWEARYIITSGFDSYLFLYENNDGFWGIERSFALRPIVTLKASAVCVSGDGTQGNPCIVG